MEWHKAHPKNKKDQEDLQLGFLLSPSVIAPRVSEGLQHFHGNADIAKHNQYVDTPEKNLHK